MKTTETVNWKSSTEREFPPLRELLELADREKFLSGYVNLSDPDVARVAIFSNQELVGFFSPRDEGTSFRIGALYVKPNFRKAAIGFSVSATAISPYFEGKHLREVTDLENLPAKSLMTDLGMQIVNRIESDNECQLVWEGIINQ